MPAQRNVLGKIDVMLVRFSRLFGTGLKTPLYQHGLLLFSFGIIHAAAFFLSSVFAWFMLWLGFLGVLGVGRAWVANEKLRTKIARKLSDVDPDGLPDLRVSAFISSFQLFMIIPFLMKSSHEIFDLYKVPEDDTLGDWLLLGVDLLFRSILDWSEIYGVNMSDIKLDSMGGRHLVMAFLLTIDFILIQGIVRIFEIRRTISEGVAAAVRDPEMAYRLGGRAVPSLLQMLDDDSVVGDDCKHVIEALAVLREQRACDAIISRFEDDDVHTTAVAAMVTIGNLAPLLVALTDEKTQTRIGALTAIRRMGDKNAIPTLESAMSVAEPHEREKIVRAFSSIGVDAHPNLIQALSDESKTVQLAALQGLTLDRSETLMLKLIDMANNTDPDVRLAAIDAMQRFTDGRVVAPLAAALDDDDLRISRQARRSLDHLESVVARKGTESDQ
ncbi:MAG: HEAT repeat domain-containing protein [Candidatus Thermoplasmatota archaeon]|nr:HEAT repeat domain-containing protein [Candidatus Thermoplasmatota archaeon]